MVRTIINAIRALPALGERIRREPIVLVGLAMAALHAFSEANGSGLGVEDTWIFVADAVLTWVGRELVFPAVKVRQDPTLTVIEEDEGDVPEPAYGDDEFGPRPGA